MKRFFAFLLPLIFIGGIAGAQKPQRGDHKRTLPKIGIITGKVVDKVTGKPVEYATVAVMRSENDKLLSGTITARDGGFIIEDLPVGTMYLRIEFMGYENYKSKVLKITPQAPEIFVGKISLAAKIATIDGVEITAEKVLLENKIDKKIINVQQDIVSSGGSAIEVLENAPSVDVDTEGNISLRGSENVKVLLDGRPSGLTAESAATLLEQLPASEISSIELITNPSSKYDPEGMAGIINIVLKKNKLIGMNGQVSAGFATNNAYHTAASVNIRNEKMNLYVSGSLRNFNLEMEHNSIRNSFFNESSVLLDKRTKSLREMTGGMARIGADIFLNSTNTLSINTGLTPRNHSNNSESRYTQTDSRLEDDRYYIGVSDDENSGLGYSLNSTWEKRFTSKDHYLKADVNASFYQYDKEGVWLETDTDEEFNPAQFVSQERNITDNINNDFTLSVDYAQPLNNEGKFEAGLRSTLRSIDQDFSIGEFIDGNPFVADVNRSNRFVYDEVIHAVYGQYGRKWNKFSAQAGLRGEKVSTASDLKTTGEKYNKDYFSLYPSLFLMYQLTDNDEVKINYSRRVHRPHSRQLNPFGNSTDPMSVRRGNPYLDPEYVNSLELAYDKRIGAIQMGAALFYRYTEDVIQRINQVDENGVTIMTFDNLTTGEDYGVELSYAGRLAKFWRLNGSFNFYQTELSGSSENVALSNSGLMWNTKLSNNLTFGHGFSAQVSGRYYGPRVLPQGEMDAFYMVDAAIKKELLKKKLVISANMRDVFKSRQYNFYTEGVNFRVDGENMPITRSVMFSLTYKFGKMQTSFDKRKRNGSESIENGEDMEF